MSHQHSVCVIIALFTLSAIGCGESPSATDKTTQTDKKNAKVSSFAPGEETPQTLNAAHILIQHVDSDRATDVSRTREEALELATKVAEKATEKNADFAALAAEYSDGPSSTDGGNLGNFAPGQMVPAFSEATMKLKVGEVSDPVESQFGYHIILRKEIVEDLCAAHILIQYVGGERASESITRTKEEALEFATEIAKKAQADGADFAALAKEHSDGPSGPNGGDLGQFPPGRMIPSFSAATALLKINEISDPVESDFGYHIILRKELPPPPKPPRTVSARHILIQYKGSERADASVTRTQEEAKTRIDEVVEKLKAGEDFAALAKEYSDGPSGPNGGDLSEFAEGMMHPAFNDAAFALEVDGTSDIVETPFGYHVIYRYK